MPNPISSFHRRPRFGSPDLGVEAIAGLQRVEMLLLGLLFLLSTAVSTGAQQIPSSEARPTFVTRSEDELLLFALHLGQTKIAEVFPAYPTQDRLLIPLGELCRLLDFAITVEAPRGLAEGFFIRESRRFHLDVSAQQITIEGQQRNFDPQLVEVHLDDIYVETRLISDWLPLDIVVDLYGATLTIKPHEPLPAQLRRQREQNIQKSLASLGYGGPKHPPTPNPHRAFDGPFVDETLRVSWTSRAGGGYEPGFQSSTFLTGDLLFTEAEAYLLADDKQGFSDTRLSVGRTDPAGRLLGPLRARQITFGEVLFPGVDLVARSLSGVGFRLSNFPLQRPTQFDRHTFRGDLQPGWEVEMYQNNALIAFQQSRSDGLYEFTEVPLLFGLNIFRLVFYGPQGQRREETVRFNVGLALTPRRTYHYRVVTNDPDKGGGQRSLLEFDAGLAKNLSTSFAVAELQMDDGRHRYAKGGLRSFWNVVFAHVDLVRDMRGGSLVEGGLQTRLGSVGLSVRQTQLKSFVSELFRPDFGEIARRTTLGLNALLRPSPRFALPITLDMYQDQLVSGDRLNYIASRVSASYRGWFMSNRLTWTPSRSGEAEIKEVGRGQVLISKFLRDFSVRGEVVYDVTPKPELANIALTASILPAATFVLQAGVSRALKSNDTRYLLGVNKLRGAFGLGINAEYGPNGFTLVGTLSAGLSRDRRTGQWHSQARPLAGLGAASALVFIDSNVNGRKDPEEEAIEKAGFFVNRASSSIKTDRSGIAFLTNLPSYQETELGISPSTLEDPLLVPQRPGVRFVPRAGNVATIDFPVWMTGEITGTVFVQRQEGVRELGGVRLQLLDSKGTVHKEVRTAYDGFYELGQIAPGRYTLAVALREVDRLKLVGPISRLAEIGSTGTVLDGLNLVLNDRSATEVATSTPTKPPTGTIAGTVFIRRQSSTTELAGVNLRLIDANGMTTKEARTTANGCYEITQVPPGRYTLAVAFPEIPRLKLIGLVSRIVEITAVANVDDVNLVLDVGDQDSP